METNEILLKGNIVDVVSGFIFPGIITIRNGKIHEVRQCSVDEETFLMPGLVDAHIHIESSLMIPSEFARLACVHGTVATVSDPHEIANVLGIEGVRFMIRNGKKVPFKFFFGAPSCVPATPFETSGARIGSEETEALLKMPEVSYLAEMMNFPGVVSGDRDVLKKLELARKYGKPVDGHSPGLSGNDLQLYIDAGITTDHECFTLDEAVEKINRGMKVLIREGSAARNFDTLVSLIDSHPDSVMLCSDDKHPDELVDGHIQVLLQRAIEKGSRPMNAIRTCTINPVRHYNLNTGLLQPGDPADLIRVGSLETFDVLETWIDGRCVASNGQSYIPHIEEEPGNNFCCSPVNPEMLRVPAEPGRINVITAFDGQLVTGMEILEPLIENGFIIPDTSRDILKIVVKDRYADKPPAIGFIHNFGIKNGALASSVAHDSHNIVAIGTDDESLSRAINLLVKNRGGLACVVGNNERVLPLPYAGIMSGSDGYEVAAKYRQLDRMAKESGCLLNAPFMSLSFMALLVIPKLKMSDRGLFSFNDYGIIPLFTS